MRGILLRLSLTCLVVGGVIMTTWDTAMAQQRRGKYTFKQKKLKSVRKQNRKLSRKDSRKYSRKGSITNNMEGALHMAGAGNLFLNVSAGERTFAAEGSYDHNISERFFSRTTFSFEWGSVFSIPYRGYYFHHGLGGAFFNLNNRYYFNGLLGVTAVYDDYPALELLNDRWNLGLHYGLEAEIGILPTLATVVNTRQLIMRESPNRWLVSAGLKFRLH